MAAKTATLAIMFADISGSTKLFETLGDKTAQVKVAECLNLLANVIKSYNGKVIKTIGDGIMCTFEIADNAASAAMYMHEILKEDVTEGSSDSNALSIRVGIHCGPVLVENKDIFGDTVNVAARMAAQAKSDQIIITQSIVDQLSSSLRTKTRFVDRAPIKGKSEDIDIFELIWQDDVTNMVTGILTTKSTPEVGLVVNYNDRRVILNRERPSIIIGRGQGCDLPVDEELASRQHARIEFRRDKFYLIDQSTNGTHVLIESSEEAFLRREEMPLSGNGRISLGKSFDENPTEVVVFSHVA